MSYKAGLLLICCTSALLAVTLAAPEEPGQEGSQGLEAQHWVVSVPQGLDRARRLAEEHDLNFLGEVIPETDLYHFSAKDHRRKKRSLTDIHQTLAEHPDIEAVHPQNEILTRVKRRPFDDDDEDVLRQKRQVPGPRSSGAAGEGKEVCFISTKETDQKGSKRCVFPFSFKGKSYVDCTKDHSSNEAEWCATEVNKDGEVVSGQWGDCDREAVPCFVIGTSSNRVQPGRPPVSGPPPPPPQARQPPRDFRPELLGPQRGQQEFLPPNGFFPGGSFRPGDFPPLNRLPIGPHRQQQPGGFPGLPQGLPQGFPFGQDFLGGQAGQKRTPFPPETPDPSLLNKTEELMNHFNDQAWPYMWFLNRGGRGSHGLDMNVDEAWAEGVTGKGVVVTILDDGIEWNHPDLEENYDPKASIDLNDNDEDPMPRYDFLNSNKHGTRCAGTVAAVANNSICAVGIAYNSKVGGIRILDGNILDALEAKALSFNRNHIDVYSASWGPDDNGQTVDGPGPMASRALRDGVEKGRNGKGSIFVWASGNGGKYMDNCNCDGYTTSIYTLSVSSVSEVGTTPWYSEACSSSLATTFSSGSKAKPTNERKVVTTDLHKECTDQHTGTSASSPMAAGIIALALEANPELTWRDLQHLVIRTSRPKGLLQANDWATNAAGLQFSHSYGFGLMDAGHLVKLAKKWKNVPEQKNCSTDLERIDNGATVGPQRDEIFELDASECGSIKHLEHVQLHIDLTSQARRGDLSILVLSPSGTTSKLLADRPNDQLRTGLSLFAKWPMMSVHFWGEPVTTGSSSRWKLLVVNSGDRPSTLNSWGLTFYGTEEDPQPGIEIGQIEPVKPDLKPVKPVLEDIPEEASASTEEPKDEDATEALDEEDEESQTVARLLHRIQE